MLVLAVYILLFPSTMVAKAISLKLHLLPQVIFSCSLQGVVLCSHKLFMVIGSFEDAMMVGQEHEEQEGFNGKVDGENEKDESAIFVFWRRSCLVDASSW
ncbi:hypothetical protein L1987_35988 [Smallanthus sonchifolius]|uniref:Uncharacterized protein n=1 Tax=Smallanthus sonchifolius TaxID=185202 RepID=A0ACB9HCC1_9ASTR|nr:hypothetical protein L1987_35988 [Smallanthus sonchifolius]